MHVSISFITLITIINPPSYSGPSVEINFMGFAQLSQKGHGIHLRQYARAFLIQEGSIRVVFVSVDAGMISHAVKTNVRILDVKINWKFNDIFCPQRL